MANFDVSLTNKDCDGWKEGQKYICYNSQTVCIQTSNCLPKLNFIDLKKQSQFTKYLLNICLSVCVCECNWSNKCFSSVCAYGLFSLFRLKFVFHFTNAIKNAKHLFKYSTGNHYTFNTFQWNYYRFTFNSDEKARTSIQWNSKDAIWLAQPTRNELMGPQFDGLFIEDREKNVPTKFFMSMNIDHE